MSKKENVNIIRADDFESIDEELANAMSLLDESNTRVLEVLTSETVDEATGELLFETAESSVQPEEEETAPPQEGEEPGD